MIEKIQNKLKSLGYYQGQIDSLWGPMSQKALQEAIKDKTLVLQFDFDKFREIFPVSRLTQSQVDSINTLFSYGFNRYLEEGSCNPLYIAYMLGTTYHETAHTMLPIKERGSYKYLSKYDTGRLAKILGNTPEADGDGQKYLGRGYVQITGLGNYKKFSRLLGVDLVNSPDKALDPKVATSVLCLGCLKGLFTGVPLGKYIRLGTYSEFTQARRVVNGTDKASAIAKHAQNFLQCIQVVQLACTPYET